MSKYSKRDHVRVTATEHRKFDQVGVVLYASRIARAWKYGVQFGTETSAIWEHELTLADPDVHTVLDEMDTESGRVRSKVLRTAESLVNGDRARDYGDPAENFGRIADLWAPILGLSASPEQVALCMAQVKVARLITSPTHSDSWIDLCGYAALGAEIVEGL